MDYKTCPQCGKNMIRKSTHVVLTSMPPQYPWIWWCACGHEESGGTDVGMSPQELDRRRFEAANEHTKTNGDPAAGI